MTVDELIAKLMKVPQDAIVMYKHNKYGRIDVDKINFEEELMYSGEYVRTVTLEGSCEED